ncbi:hypothetical protein L1987_02056 [Smallanthus sonchifolius]|uniref:Uncharacterized protein n=1 Tax=Smallanthus sonchifolius TaxID=185202 RepID=A0ACB9K6T3_9ASTR|nr:hypothetical protein L1987_02056 [Smallanthus sonchifolius]
MNESLARRLLFQSVDLPGIVKGWEHLFVLVLVEAGIFPLHAIPMGILCPWKKKYPTLLEIVTQCIFLKLSIHLKENIGVALPWSLQSVELRQGLLSI